MAIARPAPRPRAARSSHPPPARFQSRREVPEPERRGLAFRAPPAATRAPARRAALRIDRSRAQSPRKDRANRAPRARARARARARTRARTRTRARARARARAPRAARVRARCRVHPQASPPRGEHPDVRVLASLAGVPEPIGRPSHGLGVLVAQLLRQALDAGRIRNPCQRPRAPAACPDLVAGPCLGRDVFRFSRVFSACDRQRIAGFAAASPSAEASRKPGSQSANRLRIRPARPRRKGATEPSYP